MREKQCLVLSIVSGLLITHHSFTHHFIRKGAFILGGPAFPQLWGEELGILGEADKN